MSKRRSRLLPVSVACIVALAAGPAIIRWKDAPWNRRSAVPLAVWDTKLSMPQYLAWSQNGNAIIALAEVRAARGRTATAAAAARMKRENVFEGLERQAWMAGAAAELMISGMNRFIDELEVD